MGLLGKHEEMPSIKREMDRLEAEEAEAAATAKLEYLKNASKSEHLRDGIPPIIACIGTEADFENDPSLQAKLFIVPTHNQAGVHDVDYFGDPESLRRQNFKNAGEGSYAISPVDNLDKLSRKFRNCTGLVVAGVDKKTGKNMSLLSHEDPGYFLDERNNNKDSFLTDLRQRLQELHEKSAEGTVDAVIVGGNWFKWGPGYKRAYRKSIELLSQEVENIFGFMPVVMTGPKTTGGEESVFYNNEHRRLYIVRPRVGRASTESFIRSEMKTKERRWGPES